MARERPIPPTADCAWCRRPYAVRRGGRGQRFCTPSCRRACHEAARAWALAELAAGRLTLDPIRNAAPATCAFARRAETPAPLPDSRPPDPALVAALRARGALRLTVPIAPEGIIALVAAGWLDRRACRDPAAVADALVELCNAALNACLQPEQT
jgi:hypothetical protein